MLAVGRPSNALALNICNAPDVAAIRVHHVNLIDPALTFTAKRDLFSVGRPFWKLVKGRILGEILQVAAIGIHRINLGVAVAIARKSDLLSVRRPHRQIIIRRIVCQSYRNIVDTLGDGAMRRVKQKQSYSDAQTDDNY